MEIRGERLAMGTPGEKESRRRRTRALRRSAAAGGVVAGGAAAGDAALVRGEAVGLFADEGEGEGFVGEVEVVDRVLGGDVGAVFDFDGEVGGVEDWFGEVEDVREFGGGEAVVGVVGDPGLEETGGGVTAGASAVDEVLVDAADFGDVEVSGDERAAGKLELDLSIAAAAEDEMELLDVHGGALWGEGVV